MLTQASCRSSASPPLVRAAAAAATSAATAATAREARSFFLLASSSRTRMTLPCRVCAKSGRYDAPAAVGNRRRQPPARCSSSSISRTARRAACSRAAAPKEAAGGASAPVQATAPWLTLVPRLPSASLAERRERDAVGSPLISLSSRALRSCFSRVRCATRS
eukprot:scaffold75202_cov27-Tisochrysis_lutea.AAC.2